MQLFNHIREFLRRPCKSKYPLICGFETDQANAEIKIHPLTTNT